MGDLLPRSSPIPGYADLKQDPPAGIPGSYERDRDNKVPSSPGQANAANIPSTIDIRGDKK